MSAEVSIYQDQFVNQCGETIFVDTKDGYLNGESYRETQVFLCTQDDHDLIDVFCHNLEISLQELKVIHDQVVNKYQHLCK